MGAVHVKAVWKMIKKFDKSEGCQTTFCGIDIERNDKKTYLIEYETLTITLAHKCFNNSN